MNSKDEISGPVLGCENYAMCDSSDLPNKVSIGDHIIIDFGQICLKVIGFEDEADFFENFDLIQSSEKRNSHRQIRTSALSF